ncbi:ATP-grasp fold amidoligase family protein [Maribacter sp.]|uniref:ATP-grasp fold amidoligase family protein n=1 Tax=Maribacter sp. TaxID=1897614 RepID=UPI0025BA5F6A|nr:ATP-grasp fold amidoligase family protein [Maribacter sp.]
MRSLIKKLADSSEFTSILIQNAIGIKNKIVPLETRLKQRFYRKLGYKLNLNNPITFNEKIQWLKLNDRSPLHTICADKYAVRTHVAKKIGEKYLVPLVFETKEVLQLTKEKMPNYPVIIKTNHDSSGGEFIWDKNKVDWKKIQNIFKKRIKINYDYGKGEWQYKNIEPCIIVEKLLIDDNGEIPSDYKLHCFNGELAFVQVDMDRSTHHKRILYDPDWNSLDCQWAYDIGYDIPKPKVFMEMKNIAKKFAEDFIYVRVDLYVIKETIFFGELTFHSDSGTGKFFPEKWDKTIGNWLKLPIN